MLSDDDEKPSGRSSRDPPARYKQLPAPIVPEISVDEEKEYDPDYKAPAPTRAEDGTLIFEADYTHFTPNLTPSEMFKKGAFGGTYWRATRSFALAKALPESDKDEFPASWWQGLDAATMLTAAEYDEQVNCYGVKAGQSCSRSLLSKLSLPLKSLF